MIYNNEVNERPDISEGTPLDMNVLKDFKRHFEQLYKELLKMVMTAQTSMQDVKQLPKSD